MKIPTGAYRKGDKVFNSNNEVIELFKGRWCAVKNVDRFGWWRFNNHYDRDGYCDNPSRGY